MIGPPEIWIDERVVRTMATEPDPHESAEGAKMLRYVSDQVVRDLIGQSSGGAEFFIQISESDQPGDRKILGLTNFGRIFSYSFEAETWTSGIGVPDFGVPAGS